jgi:hypothetical protein
MLPDKILRITFNGISTLFPGLPPGGDGTVKKAFVLMAANRKPRRNQWKAIIEEHSPFVYVPVSVLSGWIPPAADSVEDEHMGACNIYFINDARVVIEPPPPKQQVEYFTDNRPRREFERKERPGSDDVVSEHDVRWLMDVREVAPHARLKKSANPAAKDVGAEVAAVVELDGGIIKANFPCKSVQPKTFKDAKKGQVKGFKRVLASEFFIEMRYPASTQSVALLLKPLRADSHKNPPSGIGGDELILRWGDKAAIDIRMGNDPKAEARSLRSFRRCDARTRDANGAPVAIPRDDDFELHYDLLDMSNSGRPLPENGPHQTQFDGCSPASTGG